MAWTNPKTMGTEIAKSSDWNTYVRDLLRYLKGLDGDVQLDDDLDLQNKYLKNVGAAGAQGQILYHDGTGFKALAPANGKFLMSQGAGANPVWADTPVASGIIAMWHGTIANIPTGWVICDGNNSTPNLLGKFVEGVATAATNPGTTGGASSKTLSVSEMPSHYHNNWVAGGGNEWDAYTSATSAATGNENNVRTRSTGGGSSFDIRPPYYDIAFVMKT